MIINFNDYEIQSIMEEIDIVLAAARKLKKLAEENK